MKKILFISILMSLMFIAVYPVPKEYLHTGVSLVFPGMGLIKIQEENSAKAFAASEIILLGTSASMFLKSQYDKDNSVDYASYVLNKNISSYPEEILLKMESYMSAEEYNATLPAKARQIYPNSTEDQLEYIESKTIPDSLSWEYSLESDREAYSSMRSSSRRFKEFMFYSLTGAAVNHIASAIFTYFKASEFYKPVEFNGGFGMNSFIISIGVKF